MKHIVQAWCPTCGEQFTLSAKLPVRSGKHRLVGYDWVIEEACDCLAGIVAEADDQLNGCAEAWDDLRDHERDEAEQQAVEAKRNP